MTCVLKSGKLPVSNLTNIASSSVLKFLVLPLSLKSVSKSIPSIKVTLPVSSTRSSGSIGVGSTGVGSGSIGGGSQHHHSS